LGSRIEAFVSIYRMSNENTRNSMIMTDPVYPIEGASRVKEKEFTWISGLSCFFSVQHYSFNSRTCQLVLGAEARKSADLPTISARNLALASRSVQLIARFFPDTLRSQRFFVNNPFSQRCSYPAAATTTPFVPLGIWDSAEFREPVQGQRDKEFHGQTWSAVCSDLSLQTQAHTHG
uniref:Vps54 domain-containing protein n=1 Tax=Echinostoma caproni TaxID=27848 RepID=A0A183A429_9TREM